MEGCAYHSAHGQNTASLLAPSLLHPWTLGCCCALHSAHCTLHTAHCTSCPWSFRAFFCLPSDLVPRALGLQKCVNGSSFPHVLRIQAGACIFAQQMLYLLRHLSHVHFFLCTCMHRNATFLLRGKSSSRVQQTHHPWLFM